MSDITCPYDGDYCRKMQDRIDSMGWGTPLFTGCLASVGYNKKFESCPLENAKVRHEECQRYRRYEYIIKTFGQIQK